MEVLHLARYLERRSTERGKKLVCLQTGLWRNQPVLDVLVQECEVKKI